jgi:hypothetical protein
MSQQAIRRKIAPRRVPVKLREDTTEESGKRPAKTFSEKLRNLSANSKVYYLKVATAVIIGLPAGLFFDNDLIVKNWFLIPLFVLLIDILAVRYIFKISEDDISWLRLSFSGTISLFISFIVVSSLVWMLTSGEASKFIAQITTFLKISLSFK